MGSEWKEVALDQLGRIVTGKTPPSSRVDYFGGNIPFVTPTDFDGRRLIESTGRYLTERGADAVRSSLIPGLTVMVSCIGSDMGKAAIADRNCVTNQQINSIIVKSGNDPLFVYYNLSTRKAEIRAAAGGSAQPILNKSMFGQLDILLPPLPEQRAIAHILGTLDDKIELNRRMNETLEAMARALFTSWFVDFDPVRAKMEGRWPYGMDAGTAALFPDAFEESALGEVPKGWKVGRLRDVAEHPRRGIQPDQIEPDTPYIALEHMPKRCIALSDWGAADGVESNKFKFKAGEILFGKLRPYFHKVGVAPVDGVCSTDIVVVAPRSKYWFGFVLGHMSSDTFVEYANAGSTGTKMPRTSWSDMAQYEVAIPPTPITEAFAHQVRTSVERIIAAIHESRTLAALRDTLLPRLISGELRVKDAERFLEERGV
jgi:type I restriction enzyme S subunit